MFELDVLHERTFAAISLRAIPNFAFINAVNLISQPSNSLGFKGISVFAVELGLNDFRGQSILLVDSGFEFIIENNVSDVEVSCLPVVVRGQLLEVVSGSRNQVGQLVLLVNHRGNRVDVVFTNLRNHF